MEPNLSTQSGNRKSSYAADVDYDGSVDYDGYDVDFYCSAVRPAVVLRLF